MKTTTTNAAKSLKLALVAVNEARRLLAGAAMHLDLAGCEAEGNADEVYASRDAACELRDLASGLCDEVKALTE